MDNLVISNDSIALSYEKCKNTDQVGLDMLSQTFIL